MVALKIRAVPSLVMLPGGRAPVVVAPVVPTRTGARTSLRYSSPADVHLAASHEVARVARSSVRPAVKSLTTLYVR